jgi:putative sterol carrier protein
MQASIRWCITGRPDGGTDSYVLEVNDGRCHVVRSNAPADPRLTITLDGADFLRLISGNLEPMKAYFKGRIKLSGDIMVAAKLATLFHMPGGSPGNGSNGNRD